MQTQEPEAWSLIATRVVFEHPRLSLVEDTVQLPSGTQTEWLRFQDRRDFVLVICMDPDHRILVSRQYCHPVQRVVHEFPGGLADAGETYAEAAKRELMEEVGWYPHQLEELGSFLPHVRRSSVKGRVFLAWELEARRLLADHEEFIAYEWLDVATIEHRMRTGEFDNSHLLAAWNLFRLHRPQFFTHTSVSPQGE